MTHTNNDMNDLDIIVLAGGKGTRMGGDIAKVLTPVAGKPMLSYVLDAVRGVLSRDPVVVIGYQAEKVKEAFGAGPRYAHQTEQRGTGHAVKVALEHVRPEAKHIFVLYGDHPVIQADTIRSVYEKHAQKDRSAPVTLATVRVPDFNEWRKSFFDFGRIVRDTDGSVLKIVERKDASDAEREITELNPSYFCFDAAWLRDRIEKIGTQNAQGEYYLTDLIGMAQQEGHKLHSHEIPAHEALGVNTPEQLEMVLKFIR